MNKNKIILVVKGYLLKDKKSTGLISLFLCFATVFLLVGNQLFTNVQTANRLNAEALEGKQHATYYGISEEEFQKIKRCSFVSDAGQSFYLGRTEDGTAFDYIDESFRDLSATVTDENIKRTLNGRWAEKENEIVFTQNYMEQYGLNLGDIVSVDLTATDADTGEVKFSISGLTFTIVGTIDNVTGFTDRKTGYVSKELAESIIKEKAGMVDAVVRFEQQEKISEYFDRLNTYLGYEGEELETLNARKNLMLADAVDDGGTLKKQNKTMNFTIWLVCVMVVYNIFFNRLFEKKRDFIALRKIGFQAGDLLKITGMEFLILLLIGFTVGILTGVFVNKAVYSEVMKVIINTYDAGEMVSSNLSWDSVKNAGIMLLLIIVPCIAIIMFQLRNVMPMEVMRGKRKNTRKILLAFTVVSLAASLISILGIQDNHSDEGILSVKEYVPGDLQITSGSIFENILGGNVPSISDHALQEIEGIPGITQVQDYEINYGRGIFLCIEKGKLNADGGYYEAMLEMEQKMDGKSQCLYNLILVATDNMKALVPSYDEKNDGHVAVMEGELAETLSLDIGEVFTLYDEQLIETGQKDGCKSVEVKLLDTRNIILSENHLGGNLLIVDRETARLFPGGLYRQVVNVWVDDEGDEPVISPVLEHVSKSYGYSFHSASRQMQKYIDSDRNQKVMHWFFIILLASIGLLIYFNTVFTNQLNRRNDFTVMHKIGIRKKEMYGMVLKEGMYQGVIAVGVTGIVQAALCMNRHESFPMIFIATDIGLVTSCVLFPIFILYYMFHKRMCW